MKQYKCLLVYTSCTLSLQNNLFIYFFFNLFRKLLSEEPSRLEVSYNSSGLLSHILSDGEEAWTITSVTRNECMFKIVSYSKRLFFFFVFFCEMKNKFHFISKKLKKRIICLYIFTEKGFHDFFIFRTSCNKSIS